MKIITNDILNKRLDLETLIKRLEVAILEDRIMWPPRHVHTFEMGHQKVSLLIMPVWKEDGDIMLKAVTYYPDNGHKELPTIHAGALQFNGKTGEVHACCDADLITSRRTAASSALAAKYLARQDAKRYLFIGTGQLAFDVIRAHRLVRDFDEVAIWGRCEEKARELAARLQAGGITAKIKTDLRAAISEADIISSATSTEHPVIMGEWVKSGTHIDLIGAFREDMRESDNVLITKARIFVDTLAGALRSGDLAQPINAGLITEEDIIGDIFDIVRQKRGRNSVDEITMFKSSGFALQDYVAMELAVGFEAELKRDRQNDDM